jgi:hypothetical protein
MDRFRSHQGCRAGSADHPRTCPERSLRRQGDHEAKNASGERWEKPKRKETPIPFAALLKHAAKPEGLTDDQLPMIRRSGGSVVKISDRRERSGDWWASSHARRHSQRAGAWHPFDGFPYAGLLELVRDLVEYAYRDMTAEARVLSPAGQPDY